MNVQQPPAGWKVVDTKLPPGWKVKASTPRERDEERARKDAGIFATPEKTPEDIGRMTLAEKREYIEEMNREREFMSSKTFGRAALSGLSFGLSENVPELKQTEYEEGNPYGTHAVAGHLAGSFLPISKLANFFQGTAVNLAAKSPVFQRQLTSLASILGIGATGAADEAITSVMKGKMPTAEDMMERGAEWMALDTGLHTLGLAGKFSKAIYDGIRGGEKSAAKTINQILEAVEKSGVDMTDPEAIANKAMEIVGEPSTKQKVAGLFNETTAQRAFEEAEAPILKKDIKELKPPKDEISPLQIKNEQLSKETSDEILSKAAELAEPVGKPIDFKAESENLAKSAFEEKINNVGERAISEEVLGDSILNDINANLEKEKLGYKDLYKEVDDNLFGIVSFPQNTARVAGERLKDINKVSTRPPGYTGVINHIENVIKDIGFKVQRDAQGAIEHIISDKPVPVANTMEMARRLNEIIDYESIEPTVKDVLKSIVRAAKADVRVGLAGHPDTLAAFELAEAEYARVAKKYGGEAVGKIRHSQAGEKVSKMMESPSALGQAAKVVSKGQLAQIERELLEKLQGMNYDKALKQYRELKTHLTENSRKLADEIVASKNPHNPSLRNKAIQEGILDDVAHSFTVGSRPKKTLDLWKTEQGRNLVEKTFKGSPNWPSVKRYLETQSFDDMIQTTLKGGRFDIGKFETFIKSPEALENIRDLGGQQAVTFFKGISQKIEQFQRNVTQIEGEKAVEALMRQQRTKGGIGEEILQVKVPKEASKYAVEHIKARTQKGLEMLKTMAKRDYPVSYRIKVWEKWLKETLGLNEKSAVSVYGAAKLGGTALGSYSFGILNTVSMMIAAKQMQRMLTSPRVRSAFSNMTKYQRDPLKFIMAMHVFEDAMKEEENNVK